MKRLNIFERFIYWLDEKLARYDCDKGRHRWGYTLSESGIVYVEEFSTIKQAIDCALQAKRDNQNNT